MRSFKKLVANVERCWEGLKDSRARRTDLIRERVGKHYSDNGTAEERPVNMLDLALGVYERELAPSCPQAMVRTKVRPLRPWADTFELDLNSALHDMDLGAALRRAAAEALVAPMGIIKVGLAPTAAAMDPDGWVHDAGRVYADCVTLDDFVWDLGARRWDQCAFFGDYYLVPHEWLMAMPGLNEEARSRIRPVDSADVPQEDASEIGQPQSRKWDTDSYVPMVRLIDVWCPHYNTLFTWVDGQAGDAPLREVPFDGPSQGPYHRLVFQEVQSNVMGLPLGAQIRDLNGLENRLVRRMKEDSETRKTLLAFQAGNADDAQRAIDSRHNTAVRLDNPQAIKSVQIGGVAREDMILETSVRNLISYVAGNLDQIGGLGPQSDTVGQEQLLVAAASKKINEWKKIMYRFSRDVVRSVAWYLWTDPLRESIVEKRVPGRDIVVQEVWSPETREGEWLDYNIDIDPFSMESMSPQQRLGAMQNVLGTVVQPLAGELQAQNGTIDVKKVVQTVAKLSGVEEEFQDIFVWLNSQQQQDQGQPMRGKPPALAAQTKRTYERVNRSTPDPMRQMMSMMEAGPQEGEL